MKKTDVAVVILLFVALVGWIVFSPKFLRPATVTPAPVEQVDTNAPAIREAKPDAAVHTNAAKAATAAPEAIAAGQGSTSNAAAIEPGSHAGSAPQTLQLASPSASIKVSSWGGGIVAVKLDDFLEIPSTNSLELDFSSMPSLAYGGLPGLSTNFDFVVTRSNDSIRVSRDTEGKLRFVRSLSFAKNYLVKVTDEFINIGNEPLVLPEHTMNVGPMRNNKGETASMGYSDLGIDSQARRGGEGTRYSGQRWTKPVRRIIPLPKVFCRRSSAEAVHGQGRPSRAGSRREFHRTWVSEPDWIAVKNKFFAQLLVPRKDEAGIAFVMNAKRTVAPAILKCTAGSLRGAMFEVRGPEVTVGSASNNTIVLNDTSVAASHCILVRDGWNYMIKPARQADTAQQGVATVVERRLGTGDSIQIGSLSFVFRDGERPDMQQTWSRLANVEEVSAALVFESRKLAPGEVFSREVDYYAGPKKYPILRDMGKDSVMEFGFWAPICKPLLWIINALYRVAPNYGVVIILLTILIRLVFWPVMQKSAENSRKMQELQPQLAVLKEQYKDDQQQYLKKQQELFKQNKVSVLGGCLPMLIQLPILFSLFVVLRSAVELRGAGFLWITDLSEAERLFPGLIPFWPHHINLLPILMTVVQIWQMKITPTPGDQQMQKIMLIFMPLFMLYLLYDMASGLVLYWTISQVLPALQIVLEKNRKHKPVVQLVAVGKK